MHVTHFSGCETGRKINTFQMSHWVSVLFANLILLQLDIFLRFLGTTETRHGKTIWLMQKNQNYHTQSLGRITIKIYTNITEKRIKRQQTTDFKMLYNRVLPISTFEQINALICIKQCKLYSALSNYFQLLEICNELHFANKMYWFAKMR